MRKASLLLLVLAALALVAGCGSSKKAAGTTTAAATTTTAASSTTAAAATTATSTNVGTINLAKADSSCKAMVAFGAQVSKALQSANAAAGGDLGKQAGNTAKLFDAYANAAPSEIRGDMRAYAAAFTIYAKTLSGVHLKAGKVPSASDIAKLTAASHALTAASLQQHSAHLQAWARQHCGVGK